MRPLPKPIPKLGLYLYTNAARDIAEDQNLSDTEHDELYFEMASAIVAGSLQSRNPKTGGPSKNTSSSHVTIQDINSWLANAGYPYKWNRAANATASSTSYSKVATQSNVFQSMDNLTPGEVSITFVGDRPEAGMGNNMLEISARGEKRRIALSEMGLVDRRKGCLNTQGVILLGMANKKKLTSSTSVPKQMARLRGALKSFLGINSDLFLHYNKSDGWSPRFKLQDKIGAADNRAKIEAERKTVSLDQMNETGEKAPVDYFLTKEMDANDDWLANNDPNQKNNAL